MRLSDFSVPADVYPTGGLTPGLGFLLTTWYKRDEQSWVVSLFMAGTTLAGAFGGMYALIGCIEWRFKESSRLDQASLRLVFDTWLAQQARMAGRGCKTCCMLGRHPRRLYVPPVIFPPLVSSLKELSLLCVLSPHGG